MKCISIILACFSVLSVVTPTAAHEVRPAYLEIDQTSAKSFTVVWKQPTMGDLAIHLVPHLSNGWLEGKPVDQYVSDGFLIRTWRITPADVGDQNPVQVLSSSTVRIEGLADTITDVFIRVHLRDGHSFEGIVHPQSPRIKIAFGRGADLAPTSFLILGVKHILTGPDHLLFVLGLLLIVCNFSMLLKTVSGFTLAHSLTLAFATLGQVNLPVPLLNMLIALSILFLAPEVLRARNSGTSFTIRYPWAVAFVFGLLHGLGFASGLNAVGLDRDQLVVALVLFNIGVEVGQLGFVAVILALQRAFRLMEIRWPRPVAAAPVYLIGVLGASWTLQYGAVAFGVT